MIWNPFKRKKTEETTAVSAGQAKPAVKKEKKESIEQRIEREIDSLPNMFKGKLKDPAIKKRFVEIAKRMEQDGVDFKNIRQMKKWMKEHEAELRAQGGQAPKVETVVHEGPRVGRNDPCPCGSGKKYKKCCGKDK